MNITGLNTIHPTHLYQPTEVNKNVGEDKGAPESAESQNVEETDEKETDNASGTKTENELSQQEQKEVSELQDRDKEVRAHEMAHITAGAQYITKRATFEYETGPDGQRYAVGGEVSIDVSEVTGDPQATIRKMQTVQRAALAPAEPSATDRNVAASAARKEMEASYELARQSFEENSNGKPSGKEAEKGSTIDLKV